MILWKNGHAILLKKLWTKFKLSINFLRKSVTDVFKKVIIDKFYHKKSEIK